MEVLPLKKAMVLCLVIRQNETVIVKEGWSVHRERDEHKPENLLNVVDLLEEKLDELVVVDRRILCLRNSLEKLSDVASWKLNL